MIFIFRGFCFSSTVLSDVIVITLILSCVIEVGGRFWLLVVLAVVVALYAQGRSHAGLLEACCWICYSRTTKPLHIFPPTITFLGIYPHTFSKVKVRARHGCQRRCVTCFRFQLLYSLLTIG